MGTDSIAFEIIFLFQMRKLKLREVEYLALGHTTRPYLAQ